MYNRTQTRAHTCIYSYMHARTHAHTHTYIYTQARTHLRTSPCIHIHCTRSYYSQWLNFVEKVERRVVYTFKLGRGAVYTYEKESCLNKFSDLKTKDPPSMHFCTDLSHYRTDKIQRALYERRRWGGGEEGLIKHLLKLRRL